MKSGARPCGPNPAGQVIGNIVLLAPELLEEHKAQDAKQTGGGKNERLRRKPLDFSKTNYNERRQRACRV